MTYLGAAFLVFVGGALGAVGRLLITHRLTVPNRTSPTSFPAATLLVNVLGAFLLGLVVGLADQESIGASGGLALLGVGFCGSLTTFGALAVQAWTLAARRAYGTLLAYLVTTVLASLAAAAVGLFVAG